MGTRTETQSRVRERMKIRQTLDNRIYIPGLTTIIPPPIYYIVDSVDVKKESNEIIIRLRVINPNSEVVKNE